MPGMDGSTPSHEEGTENPAPPRAIGALPKRALLAYLASFGVVGACTLIAWLLFGRAELTDVTMLLVLGVVIVAARFGYGPSLLAAVLSVIAFDFFFVTPYLSFAVSDLRHVVTFAVMFLVAVVISQLTKRIRDQADSARQRETRTASLYALSRDVGVLQTAEGLLDAAARHVREVFGVKVAFFLAGQDDVDHLELVLADEGTFTAKDKDLDIAEWVWIHQRPAGAGTETLPTARAMVVPLKGARGRVGVLALFRTEEATRDSAESRRLLETFAGLIGSALERIRLADEARRAKLRMETEQLRNALLSSVSHDLRTPLAVVTGATSALLEKDAPKDEATRRELLETVHEEAQRLNRLVGNLLDMTRLEAGALKVNKNLESLEEVVGGALSRMEDRLRGRKVSAKIPADLPLVPLDPVLMEQVLINLLENATKHTPAGTPIDIVVTESDDEVAIDVADRGAGVPPSEAERIFEKFYRAHEREGGGVGLGLTICRGIVTAHGGRIWLEPRPDGGAVFRIVLPLPKGIDSQKELPAESEYSA
jgi:two-component system sensor histidine kinase KdpD